MAFLRRHIREYELGVGTFNELGFSSKAEVTSSFVQTDFAALCGGVAACSGAPAIRTPLAREVSDGAAPGLEGNLVTIPASSPGEAAIMFQSTALGTAVWNAGTWTLPFNHSSNPSSGITLEAVHVCRVDSACNVVGTVGVASGLGIDVTAIDVFSVPVTGVQSVGAADDSFYVVAVFANSQGTDRTLGWTPSETIDTPIFADITPRRISLANSVSLVGVRDPISGLIEYPTTGVHTVRTRLFNPKAIRTWRGFGATKTLPGPFGNPGGTTPTSITWRVSDGTTDFYWDGAAWTTATLATHFSTEADVNTNLATFPVASRKIQFIAKLTTADLNVTPILQSLAFGLDLGEYDELQDLIGNSLIPALRTGLRFAKDLTEKNNTGGPSSSFTFLQGDSGVPEARLNIIDAEAAFNESTDPDHLTDILASYTPGTGVLTTSSPIPAGEILFVRFLIEPEVIFSPTHQDYIEVGIVPSVVIDRMEAVGNSVIARRVLVREDEAKADILEDPYSLNVELGILLIGETARSQLRMTAGINRFSRANPSLTSEALDEQFALRILGEGGYRSRPNLSDRRDVEITAVIEDFLLWKDARTDLDVVQVFKLNLTNVVPPSTFIGP